MADESTSLSSGQSVIAEERAPEGGFDIDAVIDAFQRCLKEEELVLDDYVRGYTEMTKFFDVLGTVFAFVSSDVSSKLQTLRCYRAGGSGDAYRSVASTLEHEAATPPPPPGAARTLLRLHRALAFVTGFLRALPPLEGSTRLATVAGPLYRDTLAQHHAWLVARSVSLALHLLPCKDQLLSKLVGDDASRQRHMAQRTPCLCDLLDRVYQATQTLYVRHGMTQLP